MLPLVCSSWRNTALVTRFRSHVTADRYLSTPLIHSRAPRCAALCGVAGPQGFMSKEDAHSVFMCLLKDLKYLKQSSQQDCMTSVLCVL
jgi:hypothetical protein